MATLDRAMASSAGPIQWAVQRGRYMSLETTAPLRDDPTIKVPALAPRQSALLLLHHSFARARLNRKRRYVEGSIFILVWASWAMKLGEIENDLVTG